jgi:divalent metal cation (Fe/Co/Zn/Cd) transporter
MPGEAPVSCSPVHVVIERAALVRRAIFLEAGIITYNVAEGVVSIAAGLLAGSVALVGFGLDSAIEVSASVVVMYHLMHSRHEERPQWESRIAGFVGMTLLALAAYVALRSSFDLLTHSEPRESWLGIGVTALSLIVMPLVSMAQRNLARRINSNALMADSRETLACTYLSATALTGLALNAVFGWWWADPVTSLAMAVFIAREGREVFVSRELLCVD